MGQRSGLMEAPERVGPPPETGTAAPEETQRRPRRLLTAVVAGAALLVLGAGARVAWVRLHHHDYRTLTLLRRVDYAVDPPDGTAGIRPDTHVVVRALSGHLDRVKVTDHDGHAMAGGVAPDGRTWRSSAPLALDKRYRVELVLAGAARHALTRTASFSTVHPDGLLKPTITPGDNQSVGVGAPIVLHFKAPVANKAAVQQALSVTMSTPVEGAWRWFGNEEIHFRPHQYWPTGEKVTMTAKLGNLDAGNNVWGEADHSVSFTVGDAHVTSVDINAHTLTVTSNGATVRTVPMSAGRTKYPTMGGVHIVLQKSYDVIMDSSTVGIPRDSPDGYYEHVYWDVAISTGGEYVHAAPWSTGAQGNSNVSHGCVNLSTDDARWFYGFSQPGDVVQVVGSPRPASDDAGTADWNLPWEQWVQPA